MNILNFIAPLVIARILSLITSSGGEVFAESGITVIRGFVSDITIGWVFGMLAGLVRKNRYVYYSLWAFLCILISLNAEHIKVNMANMDFSLAALAFKETFIKATVLSMGNLVTIVIITALCVPVLFWTHKSTYQIGKGRATAVLSILGILLVVLPTSKTLPYWMQMNVLEDNARGLAVRAAYEPQGNYASARVIEKFFAHNLSGEPIIEYPQFQPNVLIVLVEGLSYALSRSDLMPNIRSLYDESLHYKNHITPQKQTNRGLYSVVCGDYPNFLTIDAKMDYTAMHGSVISCLPEILSQNGYKTLFMQSAPLSYMQKDLFAEKTGFEEALGFKYFYKKKHYAISEWGVDDKAFFEHSMDKLKKLNEAEEPWFAVLLTSGTHHPYTVPGNATPSHEESFAYTDKAFGKFMQDVREAHLLKDTIIIITSDESSGNSNKSGLLRELEANHSPLFIMGPGVKGPIANNNYFTLADLQASVLDYTKIEWLQGRGRSVFRTYESARNLMFGNVYTQKFYTYTNNDTLYVCSVGFECDAYTGGEDGLFSSGYKPAASDPIYLEDFKHAAAANELNSSKLKTQHIFRLQDKNYTGRRYLIGDHKIMLKAGDTIVWNFDIDAIDDIIVNVSASQVKFDNNDLRKTIFHKKESIKAGSRFQFGGEFTAPYDIPYILNKAMVICDEKSRYRVRNISIDYIRN
jgi:phosphoglycerol transferase MdoB-like AlkP superfamily enzyme